MGAFDWLSYREWSQLDNVESCETVGEDEKESCNHMPNQQVAHCFHPHILYDVIPAGTCIQIEYDVETVSVSFIQVTGTSTHNTQIQTPITMLMIKCSEEEVRK